MGCEKAAVKRLEGRECAETMRREDSHSSKNAVHRTRGKREGERQKGERERQKGDREV